MPLPDDLFAIVPGFLSLPEAELLYRLALEVPKDGRIVEVGSYQGRSTIALALGAKEVGAMVWSIDHHPAYEEGDTSYGMSDNQAYYANIAHYEVGDVVKTLNMPSDQAWITWTEEIDLLWIDGSHAYEDVKRDWYLWAGHADVVAMHDTANNYYPGVTKLVAEIIAGGEWEVSEVVDATTVFKRVMK